MYLYQSGHFQKLDSHKIHVTSEQIAVSPRSCCAHPQIGHSLSGFVLCATVRTWFERPRVSVAKKSAENPRHSVPRPIQAEEHLEDPRLAIYKTDERSQLEREHLEQYKKELREKAIQEATPGAIPGTPCCIDVHYSWACLERLQKALELGRNIKVESVLLPESATEEQLVLTQKCTSVVFQTTGNLIDSGLAIKGSRKNFCRFVVAYPVSKSLSDLKGPFVVINEIASSHSLGQILRTAYHFGIDSVILSETAWQLLDSRAMRVSVGWGYHMDFHMAQSLPETLHELEKMGIGLFAECHSITSEPKCQPSKDWALLLGFQEKMNGLEISRIRVPCHESGTMDIAHAAAICIYELSGLSSSKWTGDTSDIKPRHIYLYILWILLVDFALFFPWRTSFCLRQFLLRVLVQSGFEDMAEAVGPSWTSIGSLGHVPDISWQFAGLDSRWSSQSWSSGALLFQSEEEERRRHRQEILGQTVLAALRSSS